MMSQSLMNFQNGALMIAFFFYIQTYVTSLFGVYVDKTCFKINFFESSTI